MGVAKVKHVAKARKHQGKCQACGAEIKAGDPYKWWTIGFRSRSKSKRCGTCPVPPASQRESNEKVAAIYAAEEDLTKALAEAGDREAVQEALTNAAEQIREAGELWRESAQNIEDGFGHETEQSIEQTEKADAADSWADEIEQVRDAMDETPDEDEEALTETPEEYLERIREEARSAFDDNMMDL